MQVTSWVMDAQFTVNNNLRLCGMAPTLCEASFPQLKHRKKEKGLSAPRSRSVSHCGEVKAGAYSVISQSRAESR